MNVYFLTGIPRAGNTLLASVFNQNPYAKISAHSVLPLLFNSILEVKNNFRFKNFPDFEGVDNIINNIFKPTDVIKYCDNLMLKETILSDALISTQNIIDSKKDYLLITYDDLVDDICKCVKKICEFISVSYIKPDLNNIRQLKINNIEYDDSVWTDDFHTIRTKEIKKNKYNIKDFLPKRVIDKYKNFDVRF